MVRIPKVQNKSYQEKSAKLRNIKEQSKQDSMNLNDIRINQKIELDPINQISQALCGNSSTEKQTSADFFPSNNTRLPIFPIENPEIPFEMVGSHCSKM